MRKLEFPATNIGKSRYEVCIQATLASGRPIRPDEWDDFLPLKRKLTSIGLPAQNQPAGAKKERPILHDLRSEGGQIELERGEYTLLLDLVKQPNWGSSVLEDVIDVRDWLTQLKEYDKQGVDPINMVKGVK